VNRQREPEDRLRDLVAANDGELRMTEEQIFEEFGLEPDPSSARAIVTRLQGVELEMKPSQNAQGEHEMTLRLLKEEPVEEGHLGKYLDDARPAPGAPTTAEATELPPPPNRKGGWYSDPEGSGRLRFWNKTRWTDDFMDAPGSVKPSASAAADQSRPAVKPERSRRRGRWGGAPWWAWVLGAIVLLGIISAIAGGNNSSSNDSGSNDTANTPSVKSVSHAAPAQPAPEPTATAAPEMTAGQENALRSAQGYIALSGFSRAGLIEQLSSKAGEGFSRADATFAADHVGADWNQEAVQSAQAYLKLAGMSRSGLYEQLTSSAGEGFTPAQAQYAVDKVYGG
jgi:hypothetical protein